MIYCISDVHGRREAFNGILKQIDLSPDDTLYVIGDVIDRGPDGVGILQQIMETPNIEFIMGNHELMMLNVMTADKTKGSYNYELWMRNGGEVTDKAFGRLNTREQNAVIDFLKNAGYEKEVSVYGRDYLLVHACPSRCYETRKIRTTSMNVEEYMVWHRVGAEEVMLDDKTVVFGHTPTRYYQSSCPMTIWHGDKRICIDCGAGMASTSCQLACLRLDDMKEFYTGF